MIFNDNTASLVLSHMYNALYKYQIPRLVGGDLFKNLSDIVNENTSDVNENKFRIFLKSLITANPDLFQTKVGKFGGIFAIPGREYDEHQKFYYPPAYENVTPVEKKVAPVIPAKVVSAASVEDIAVTTSFTPIEGLGPFTAVENEDAVIEPEDIKADEAEENTVGKRRYHQIVACDDHVKEGYMDGFLYKQPRRYPIKLSVLTEKMGETAELVTHMDEKQVMSVLEKVILAVKDPEGNIEAFGNKYSCSKEMEEVFERMMVNCFGASERIIVPAKVDKGYWK